MADNMAKLKNDPNLVVLSFCFQFLCWMVANLVILVLIIFLVKITKILGKKAVRKLIYEPSIKNLYFYTFYMVTDLKGMTVEQ